MLVPLLVGHRFGRAKNVENGFPLTRSGNFGFKNSATYSSKRHKVICRDRLPSRGRLSLSWCWNSEPLLLPHVTWRRYYTPVLRCQGPSRHPSSSEGLTSFRLAPFLPPSTNKPRRIRSQSTPATGLRTPPYYPALHVTTPMPCPRGGNEISCLTEQVRLSQSNIYNVAF